MAGVREITSPIGGNEYHAAAKARGLFAQDGTSTAMVVVVDDVSNVPGLCNVEYKGKLMPHS